jgi:hypothetical protein
MMNKKHIEALKETLNLDLYRIQVELERTRGTISPKRGSLWVTEQVIKGKLELIERILNE